MSDFIRWKEVDILTYLPLFIVRRIGMTKPPVKLGVGK